jgi:putative toxin-antitoxin system antitoxin component (TIGR02293 family)
MSDQSEVDAPAGVASDVQRIESLFGGAKVFRRPLNTPLDVHNMLLDGLPTGALNHLVNNLEVLDRSASLEKAVGMSLRTYQRRRDAPAKPLSQEQSGRTWKLAELLARATALFGSQRAAEGWLEQPALGLNGHRPIDLLATPPGVELVEDLLTRLEYGVYV